MSFYIYQLVEPLILPNTSSSLSAISHYQLSAIRYKLAYQSSAIFTEQSLNVIYSVSVPYIKNPKDLWSVATNSLYLAQHIQLQLILLPRQSVGYALQLEIY